MSSLKRKNDSAPDSNKKPKVNASITSFFGAPKSSPGGAPPSSPLSGAAASKSDGASAAALKFDKAKWVAGLTPEQKRHLQLEIQTLDPSWLAHLKDEIVTPEFIELKKFLESEIKSGKKVFPPREDVYSWSRHTPFHTVKCVILGQDPYHNINQAHGLAFSVRPPTPAPPSLRNMYIALAKDYPSFVPPPNKSGLLTPWAERGVLLLNTCLTVRAHEPNSHAKRGWERFTQKVIDVVAQRRTRGVVFLAWGAPAAKRVAKVDGKRHLVLKSVHPSPLSASRGFFDCGHFKATNEWLALRYGESEVIDWGLGNCSTLVKKGDVKKEMEKDEDVEEQEKENEGDKEKATPVVAVGEIDEDEFEEESKILQEMGEEGKADGVKEE
ncbi:uracil-DNA glycosylase [Annulohypoxylon truncatum]|uniref:uracil-DNA glycosylase n=1 Tax=Annulohypoxylon truncatum TaxID=327061 RepID=UPI002007C8CA|nr:uracil-DNA glycosylase [Annulohypoxylon truncatum]KAI1209732.1 uracil-DNA glycosylase [Annulohypoxylon truncatum]